MCVHFLLSVGRLRGRARSFRPSVDFWKARYPDSESVCLQDKDEGSRPTAPQGPEGEE